MFDDGSAKPPRVPEKPDKPKTGEARREREKRILDEAQRAVLAIPENRRVLEALSRR